MILIVLQILIAVFLIVAIALQMQGGGLSSTFGSSGEFYRSKRSVEKILYVATMVLAGLFAGLSLLLLYIR